MSVQGCLTVNGQMSLIDPQPRTMDVYYSMPDEPDENTGLLVLVPGFGANCNSKVYRKMRSVFADRYNLYVIQCEYFGSKFMQQISESVDLNDYYESIPKSVLSQFSDDPDRNYELLDGLILERVVGLEESESDYAEMGVVQATDILIAIYQFVSHIKSLNKPLNRKRVIGYGQSHGAYLLYLCNGLMPDFFSDIIDLNAWLFPQYIDHPRITYKTTNSFPHICYGSKYKYLVSEMDVDRESYSLFEYYQNFQNKANIIAFHGDEDTLITLDDKAVFLSEISNCSLEVIGKDRIDNVVFSSNKHGLGADFLKLFEYAVEKYDLLNFDKRSEVLRFEDVSFSTSKHSYWLGYDKRIDNIQLYILEK